MKNYREIEASRNTRLWVTQVIIPIATLATSVLVLVPEAGEATVKSLGKAKDSIKNALTKKDKESKSEPRNIIRIDAQSRDEALIALEIMAKELLENDKSSGPVRKSIRAKKS